MDTAALAQLPQSLPHWAFLFVLVLARAGCVCMVLPAVGEAEVPMMLRAGFALALTAMLLPVLSASLPATPVSPWRAAGMIGAEIAAGLFLGWLARLPVLALPLAGQLIATFTGQASVLQPDGFGGPQGAALGRLFGLVVPVLLLSGGLWALPLRALVGSYAVLPAGAPLPPADTARAVLDAVGALFAAALRLSGPFLIASVAWNVALALVTRLIPNLSVFFLAAPAQLAGGLALLGALAAVLVEAWRDQAVAAFALLPGH